MRAGAFPFPKAKKLKAEKLKWARDMARGFARFRPWMSRGLKAGGDGSYGQKWSEQDSIFDPMSRGAKSLSGNGLARKSGENSPKRRACRALGQSSVVRSQ